MASSFKPRFLPPPENLETLPVLKKLAASHRALAELKGMAGVIPNQVILVNTLGLQEAKDSSAVENIITTQDELYKEGLHLKGVTNQGAKEVRNYVSALNKGYELVIRHGLLTVNHIKEIQKELEGNRAGFRKLPGTVLKSERTGEIIYTPPQDPDTIIELMKNLERYINDDGLSDTDPLIKLAVIHFQFESIHPFYDGNGRTGRIINVLYLVQKNLLHMPVLYLSRFIIKHKDTYYHLLSDTRRTGNWEPWLLFMLNAIEETSIETMGLINGIKELMMDYKHRIREDHKFYSQELLNHLFRHPYTRIEYLQKDLNVSRITAAIYLNSLAKTGFLEKKKMGVSNYYINTPLYRLFARL